MGFLSRLFGKRHPTKEVVKTPDNEYHSPPGVGWRQWQYVSDEDMLHLYTADQVEAWRAGWDAPTKINPRSMHPTMNVYGLWWRPVV